MLFDSLKILDPVLLNECDNYLVNILLYSDSASYSLETMNCKKRGFMIIRHNNIRDFEANLLKQVCNDVEIEPPLQPIAGEIFTRKIKEGDETRLEVLARGFWRNAQSAYFDVRVTNTNYHHS